MEPTNDETEQRKRDIQEKKSPPPRVVQKTLTGRIRHKGFIFNAQVP